MLQHMVKIGGIFVLSFFFLFNLISNAQNIVRTSNSTKEFIVIDAHIHNGFAISNDKVVLSNFDYFRQRKVNAFIFPLPVERSKTENLYLRIKDEIEQIKSLSKKSGVFSVLDLFEPGKTKISKEETKVIFSIEYFNSIFDNKLENVDNYYNLGIRLITLYNSQVEHLFEGENLTLFGKELIYKMNNTGILIDISHLSDERKIIVAQYSRSPVISSHSVTRKVAENDYNLSDSALEALKANKGYVFLTFNKNDLYRDGIEKKDAVNQFIDHIDYLVKYLGNDHIGIGSDYQANGKYVPTSLNANETYYKIQNALLSRGYSDATTKKIMSENILNALYRNK